MGTGVRSRWRRARRALEGRLVRGLAPPLFRLLARTWRVDHVDLANRDEVLAADGSLITIWHGRMLLPLTSYGGHGLSVLVSPSADGSLIADLLPRFGYGVVRGSSSRSAPRAVREMMRGLERGMRIVITPDGPRGPRHAMTQGPAWLARSTGFPVLPCGMVCDRAWHLKSWDRFTIPKPGARVTFVYGEPLRVAPDETDEGVERLSAEIRARMIDAEQRGFRHMDAESDL